MCFFELLMDIGLIMVIVFDGGFLFSVVEIVILLMLSGEWYEILVDMGMFDIKILNVNLNGDGGFLVGLFGGNVKIVVLMFMCIFEIGFIGVML